MIRFSARIPGVLETPQGDAIQIPVARFLNSILPPLRHNFDPVHVVDALLHSGNKSHKPITLKGRWKGFAEDPAKVKCHEKKSFRHLPPVVQAILKASGSRETPLSFHLNPNCTMTEDKRQAESLPDAYLSVGSGRRWLDIIAFGELKKSDADGDVRDNIKKLTSSMAKCMHGDPRRRFVFAFTIENTAMRLWYCDRSQIVVSEPFNFITDHKPVVHFFLSLVYASPAEIGLDPTMVLLEDGLHYDITVYPYDGLARTYRTLETLFGGNPETLCGRGTRVWKAVKIEEGRETGEAVVLKDSWVDPERNSEGVLLERVRLADRSAEHQPYADSSFVTVECHGDVYLGTDHRNILDCTRVFGQGGLVADMPVRSRDELVRPMHAQEAAPQATSAPNPLCPKRLVHYRIVFKEVCKILDGETSFTTVFRALAQITLALQTMHSAGWVHRDVSSANILLKDDGAALLADFEYVKKVGEEDEIRVGTSYFIPVEVDAQNYKCRLVCTPPPHFVERYPEKFAAAMEKRPTNRIKPISSENFSFNNFKYPRFRYNPLHDLESLWWIAIYFLVKREIVDSDASVAATPGPGTAVHVTSDAQRTYAAELFSSHNRRYDTLLLPNDLRMGVRDWLPRRHFPLAVQLDGLRDELVYRYYAEETDIDSIDSSCANGIHEIFHKVFQQIANAESNQSLTFRPLTYIPYIPPPAQHFINFYYYPEDFINTSPPDLYHTKRRRSKFEASVGSSSEASDNVSSSSPSSAKKARIAEDGNNDTIVPTTGSVLNRTRPFLPRKAKLRRG